MAKQKYTINNYNQVMSYNKYLIKKIGISDYLAIHEYYNRRHKKISKNQLFPSCLEWIYKYCLLIPIRQYDLYYGDLKIIIEYPNYYLCENY